MARTRSFSVYLLKPGVTELDALEHPEKLDAVSTGGLPADAAAYVIKVGAKSPWWRSFFGIPDTLFQETVGAIIFISASQRRFALTFGHVAHLLDDSAYEHDFGIKVTLNCVDPEKLKSTDVLEASAARRQRLQVPIDSDLTMFDFDADTDILKSLTGKVKAEHSDLFRRASGASNLRVDSKIEAGDLVDLCNRSLTLYGSDDYKAAFPNIQNVSPVRDPSTIELLDEKLIEAFRSKDAHLYLTIPAMVDYDNAPYALFAGAGADDPREDVHLGAFYNYLESRGEKIAEVTSAHLKKKYSVSLCDEEGSRKGPKFSVYKSLVVDVTMSDGATYHLCDTNWYRVETNYLKLLEQQLDPLWIDLKWPEYSHENEAAYNESMQSAGLGLVCLDTENVAPKKSNIEPCDLCGTVSGKATLYYVKRSTFSYKLSHLFAQGQTAAELLKLDADARLKLVAYASKGPIDAQFGALLEQLKISIVFAIVTHKEQADKSKNLPLFSRMTLARVTKALRRMDFDPKFAFIKDKSAGTPFEL